MLFIAYFLEAGLVLAGVPWLAYWDNNVFAATLPKLHLVLQSNFVRGAVSGVGLINLVAGFAELVALMTKIQSRNNLNDHSSISVDG